jgi:uncharacterized small protein (DUF1192 family)
MGDGVSGINLMEAFEKEYDEYISALTAEIERLSKLA